MGKELSSTINEVLFVRFRSSWFLSAALVAFLFTYLIYPGKECGGTPGQLAFIFIFASLVDTIHASFAQGRRTKKIEKEKIKKEIEEQKSFYSEIFSDDEVRNITEKLLGNGDMLFYPSGYPKPLRVQGAFVSDGEVSNVTEFLKEQNEDTGYNTEIEKKLTQSSLAGGAGGQNERDALFTDAGKFIIEKDKASIGMLQRMFKIGFNRAARIMDQLAEAGVVGEEEGTKPRKILMSKEEFEEFLEAGY